MKKHNLIVGGTSGIGLALAKNLAEKGNIVSVIGRKQLQEMDNKVPLSFWAADLLDHDSIEDALKKIIGQNGKLSSLFFFQRFRGEGDDWKGEINVSMSATKSIIEHLAEDFQPNGNKSIVIISSIASHLIVEEQPLSYHTAKAALNQMVRYYAVKLGPKGIRVNCISPGTVLKEESNKFYSQNKKLLSLYKDITPLGTMTKSEDIVHAAEFLSSSKASSITGQNIIVDGGLSLVGQESLARKLAGLDNLKITRENGGK